MDPFRFTIALPPDPDSLVLLQEVSNHVARVVGMNDPASHSASADLQRAVAEQMRGGDNGNLVRITFERKAGEQTVTIEVHGGSGEPVPQRFTWDTRQGR